MENEFNKIVSLIKSYYDGEIENNEILEIELNKLQKESLIDFIIEMQNRGCFGRGIIHE